MYQNNKYTESKPFCLQITVQIQAESLELFISSGSYLVPVGDGGGSLFSGCCALCVPNSSLLWLWRVFHPIYSLTTSPQDGQKHMVPTAPTSQEPSSIPLLTLQ